MPHIRVIRAKMMYNTSNFLTIFVQGKKKYSKIPAFETHPDLFLYRFE